MDTRLGPIEEGSHALQSQNRFTDIHPKQSKFPETYEMLLGTCSQDKDRKKEAREVCCEWVAKNAQKHAEIQGKNWVCEKSVGKLEGIEDLRRLVEFRCANNMENVISSESQA